MEPVTVTASPALVVSRLLAVDVHPDDVAEHSIALLGWDAAVQALCASPNSRAGEVLLSILCTALLDEL